MKLVNAHETYEVVYPQADVEENKRPIFILRLLTAKEVEDMEDNLTSTTKQGEVIEHRFLAGTSGRIKIKNALRGWKNIELPDGSEAKFSEQNVNLLPAKIRRWLEERIDKDNGFTGIDEDTRKN